MQYQYLTATGPIAIELDEQYLALLDAFDDAEDNSNRKHSRRHPISLKSADYEGSWFEDKAMHRVGAAARYRMLLTGTPVTNKALDIFSQYKFLNDQIFGRSFYGFRNKFFDMTGYGQHTPVMKRSIACDLLPTELRRGFGQQRQPLHQIFGQVQHDWLAGNARFRRRKARRDGFGGMLTHYFRPPPRRRGPRRHRFQRRVPRSPRLRELRPAQPCGGQSRG